MIPALRRAAAYGSPPPRGRQLRERALTPPPGGLPCPDEFPKRWRGTMVHAVKTGTLGALALVTLLLAGSAPQAQQSGDAARIEKFKAAVVEGVDARRKLSQVMNDTVFSYGELAYQEFETSKYLTDLLEK